MDGRRNPFPLTPTPMPETCPSCGTDFPDGLAIMCKCWEGTDKQRRTLGLMPRRRIPGSVIFLLLCIAAFVACYVYRQYNPPLTPHQRQRASMEEYFDKLEELALKQREANDAKLIQDTIDNLNDISNNSK
jgi:hypothetical protein